MNTTYKVILIMLFCDVVFTQNKGTPKHIWASTVVLVAHQETLQNGISYP